MDNALPEAEKAMSATVVAYHGSYLCRRQMKSVLTAVTAVGWLRAPQHDVFLTPPPRQFFCYSATLQFHPMLPRAHLAAVL
eukprot:SAG31_NODE_436_length_15717_cov_5.420412_6_plen_81_part_00